MNYKKEQTKRYILFIISLFFLNITLSHLQNMENSIIITYFFCSKCL